VERYTRGLLELARRELPDRLRRRVDPEDVIQSVYRSFFQRLGEGRFSFEDSHDVWRLLATMTLHKTRNAVRFHQRERRDVRREVPLAAGKESDGPARVPEIAAPGPESVEVLYECLEQMLSGLAEDHRTMVLLRLEGRSIAEIAECVKRSRRTVLRVLAHLHEQAASLPPPE
jgi:RNA polymerase sigma factor (sigma-70 family)